MTRYKLRFVGHFKRYYKSQKKRRPELVQRIDKTLGRMMDDPFDPSLHTHRVSTRIFGKRFSSRVTQDLRIIWDFTDERDRLLILAVGGHEGKRKAY